MLMGNFFQICELNFDGLVNLFIFDDSYLIIVCTEWVFVASTLRQPYVTELS